MDSMVIVLFSVTRSTTAIAMMDTLGIIVNSARVILLPVLMAALKCKVVHHAVAVVLTDFRAPAAK